MSIEKSSKSSKIFVDKIDIFMQLSELKAFMLENNLKQADVATYIGSSRQYVSQLAKQYSLPKQVKSKLLDNDKGWDTSMLITKEGTSQSLHQHVVAIASGDNSKNTAKAEGGNEGHGLVLVLKKEIEMLNKIIEEKDAQIEFLKSLLTNKGDK